MRFFRIALMICMMAALGWSHVIQACTTFQIQKHGQVYFGRNYDWMVSDALVIINKRGTKKPGFVHPTDKSRPAEWTSKYGSLTFNQYGRELPVGGMNEAGLVVECMALQGTQFPAQDERPYLALPGLWRQYVLDNFATVDEVLAGIEKVRISPSANPFGPHHLISDAKGGCAVIEFLDGKLVVHQGAGLPIRALTNNTYEDSLQYYKENTSPASQWYRSITRFKTAAKMVSAYGSAPKQPPLDYAFKVLKAASQGMTQWSIVYDQNNLKVYFHTKQNPKRRVVDLKKLDFSCGKPVLIVDIDAKLEGDLTGKFEPYTLAANRDLIVRSFDKTPFLRQTPKQVLAYESFFPEKCKCAKP